jgi:host factor-I protein
MRDNQKLQNEFLNQLRKNATPVSVFLMTGERLDGQIKSFDIYSLSMNCPEPRLVVKTVIATVQPAPKRAKKSPAKRTMSREGRRPFADAPRENRRLFGDVSRQSPGPDADAPRENRRLFGDVSRQSPGPDADAPRGPRKAPEVVTKRRRLTIPKT